MLEALTGFSHLHPSSSTVNCSKCMTGKLSLLCLKKYLNQMLLCFTVLSGTFIFLFYLKHLQILGIKTLKLIPCQPYLPSTPPAPFVNCLSCCISPPCRSLQVSGERTQQKNEGWHNLICEDADFIVYRALEDDDDNALFTDDSNM